MSLTPDMMTKEQLSDAFAAAMKAPGTFGISAPAPYTRASILDAARDAVLRDRAATHGAVESSFAHLAAVWSVRLGVDVTPAQVALMLVDLKVTRAWGNPGHGDNWVDIAGYAACGGEIAGGAE